MANAKRDSETIEQIINRHAVCRADAERLGDALETGDLSDYLAGLDDLYFDFLLPLKNGIDDLNAADSTAFSDRYDYFART